MVSYYSNILSKFQLSPSQQSDSSTLDLSTSQYKTPYCRFICLQLIQAGIASKFITIYLYPCGWLINLFDTINFHTP